MTNWDAGSCRAESCWQSGFEEVLRHLLLALSSCTEANLAMGGRLEVMVSPANKGFRVHP